MTALTASWRALCVLALPVAGCEVYTAALIQPPVEGGAAGVASMGGAQGAVASGGTAGDASSGTAGEGGGGGEGAEGGQPPEPETVPYLTVTIGAPLIQVILTQEGALDWAHWGFGSATTRNQKAGVTSLLLDFKPTGTKQPTRLVDGPISFDWSDGMPTASATTDDGVSWAGLGEGFELKVPAVVDVRELRLYVGVFNGTGALKGSLSDPRANSIGDDRFRSPTTAWVVQVISITYGNASLPDTTMSVSWTLEEGEAVNAAVALTAISIR